MPKYFLITVLFFLLGAVISVIYGVVSVKKLLEYLEKNNPARWAELAESWWPFPSKKWEYACSDQDNDDMKIFRYKIGIKRGFLQALSFLLAAITNSVISAIVEFHLF